MRALVLATLLAACAPVPPRPSATPTPGGGKPPRPGASFPGFDKRDFPTLQQMQVWWNSSPYVWVGYYLPSPCFSGVAWTGNRAALMQQGWGLAVLYVGLQAPRSAARTDTTVATDSTRAAAQASRCSQNTLSAQQGASDGDDAVNVAQADGFPEGTTIFLDVERADPYPAALDTYVRAWAGRVLARRYVPGVYAHRINAAAVQASLSAVYAASGDTRQPPLWVASGQGFDLAKLPSESGFPGALIWQNPSDASETWGGVTFRIDSNVSRSAMR